MFYSTGDACTFDSAIKFYLLTYLLTYRRVNDSRHLQADCQEPGSAQEPYAR